MTFDKKLDRLISKRAKETRVMWDSKHQGVFSPGNNKAKRVERLELAAYRAEAVRVYAENGLGRAPKLKRYA